MKSFNIGDLVYIINRTGYRRINGQIGKIIRIYGDIYRVKINKIFVGEIEPKGEWNLKLDQFIGL